MAVPIVKIATLKSQEALAARFAELNLELKFDAALQAGAEAPLAAPLEVYGRTLGNRFAILPMEGWDAETDGRPSELVRRRWQRFGQSGAKLIWGGEAVAVRHDGRANPNQLVISESNVAALADLREALVRAHREQHGRTDDLFVGVQLTHSGRFARPNNKARLEPFLAYRHPILDARFQVPADLAPVSDEQIDALIADFVAAAVRAQKAGFDFVDLKHCHGYFAHELLSAVDRGGRYGGSLENRTRFLREAVAGIRREAPGLHVGVRVSIFDRLPYQKNGDGTGEPVPWSGAYRYGFGCNPGNPAESDWAEPLAFLRLLPQLGVKLVCLTGGSPYYNPHLVRPAAMPPSDGYLPPEDPLVGVARQVEHAAYAKRAVPELTIVASGMSYLQEWLPHVAQSAVRHGMFDVVGIGRSVLSYPEMVADVLAGRPLQARRICRTFSDCTTGPRNGLVSGCYPLDDFYRQHPDVARLKQIKAAAR